MYFAQARYYKPEIGRFISEDTYRGGIYNPQSLNRYGYVENNPIRWVDPSGHVKASDNEYLAGLVEGYSDKWKKTQESIDRLRYSIDTCFTVTLCQQAQYNLTYIENFKLLQTHYEMSADAVRVSYYTLHDMPIPDDVKYRKTTVSAPDVTLQLNSLMSEFEADYKDNSENPIMKIYTFYKLVKTGGRVDVKNSDLKDSSYYIYSGELYRRDDLGNIYFGYAGKVFGYDDTFLKTGAGLYQIYSGTSEWQYIFSYFDDPRDSLMIQVGIDIYNRSRK